ncbi:MAG: gluconokinase [Flavobacteriaceae bacterium]
MQEVIVIMGVSGSGKTTVGKLLADALGARFVDADDYHPIENKQKMQSGIALDDLDRSPWLKRLNTLCLDPREGHLVLACSALKASYRAILEENNSIKWVFLSGSFDQIRERLESRSGHYMPPSLLSSQFNDLETPEEALIVAIDQTPEQQVKYILSQL